MDKSQQKRLDYLMIMAEDGAINLTTDERDELRDLLRLEADDNSQYQARPSSTITGQLTLKECKS